MFEETLLDSSPTHAPVLRSAHWLICIAAGIAGYFLGRLALPFLTFAQGEALSTQAVFLAILLFFYALMLCYVYADAKHLGFSVGLWVAVTAVLYVVGFVWYLIYSATKTGNWKRATIPIAYICEVIIIGIVVLIPLMMTATYVAIAMSKTRSR